MEKQTEDTRLMKVFGPSTTLPHYLIAHDYECEQQEFQLLKYCRPRSSLEGNIDGSGEMQEPNTLKAP